MAKFFYQQNIVTNDCNPSTFSIQNHRQIARYLNSILWLCTFIGPAIAIGIRLGLFLSVSYKTCIVIFSYTFAFATIHSYIIKRYPDSIYSGSLAILFLELFLAYMDYSHVDIGITWFFVPLLSIFYCNIRIFLMSTISNYIIMIISLWFSAPYYSKLNLEYNSAYSYFLGTALGLTIETLIMVATGYTLAKIARNYFSCLLKKHAEHEEQISMLNAQMKVLSAMTGIYKYANLLDFKNMTEMSLLDTSFVPQPINLLANAHSRMNHMLKRRVTDDYFDDFQNFTNMRTLRERLSGQSVISDEFMDKETGWIRAQYIPVDSDDSGIPNMIVYTVQDIDKYKQREKHLLHMSLTDALTGLYNRRCFENDIKDFREKPLDKDLVVLSIDLNRLKYANDTMGHIAGDELLKGAADCLLGAICTCGRVYRTGGDEFSAIVHCDDVSELNNTIKNAASNWCGQLMDTLTMSIGYAALRNYPDADIDELVQIADSMMYEEKNQYYIENGIDRRKPH